MLLEHLTFVQLVSAGAITEAVIFLSYILICAAVFKRRFSWFATALAFGAAATVIVGVNAAIMLSDAETEMLMLTLLPLTAYLPFSALLYFMSDSGIFETSAVCAVGALGVLILKSLRKILSIVWGVGYAAPGYIIHIIISTVIALTAAGLVFIAFRFIGSAFRFCFVENRQNRLIISIPIIMILLMIFRELNSLTDIITLVFIIVIALSLFFITAKLLNSTAELIRAKNAERELTEYIDIQRHSYGKMTQKMESIREYRHDMRHHLAVIEGLIRQNDRDKALEYVSGLNGSFEKPDAASHCRNPEINAVLSEYIGRAKSAGCRITQTIRLPEALPFKESDICLVLANAVENAIKACSELPEGERYINISAEYTDGHRLTITVENPCAHTVEFDENGLPVSDQRSEEHGIGLRSVKRTIEKYNGFLRCMVENGEFVFQSALFYDDAASKQMGGKSRTAPKRAISTLLGLCVGTIVILNVLPSSAKAASSLLSVNIRTISGFDFGWGDNSASAEIPEFDGNGADELNSAVKSYTDEAKEKFLWYFNRRYNGYAAEDMSYTVIRDDERYFIARFNVTVNTGGSLDYSRWINFDKSAGKVLELSDMFGKDVDYVGILSEEILEQMRYKNEHEDGRFFVEGDDAFTEISGDANFYIDSYDRLVIVFDEYEVAPGFMGSPEFYIPQKLLKGTER